MFIYWQFAEIGPKTFAFGLVAVSPNPLTQATRLIPLTNLSYR